MKTEIFITKNGKNVKLKENLLKNVKLPLNNNTFNVGDIITGIADEDEKLSDGTKYPYTMTTNRGLFEVTKIFNDKTIEVEVIEHTERTHIGFFHKVESKFFIFVR